MQSDSTHDPGTTPDTRSPTDTRVGAATEALSRALQAGPGSTTSIEQVAAEYRHACAAAWPRDAAAEGRPR